MYKAIIKFVIFTALIIIAMSIVLNVKAEDCPTPEMSLTINCPTTPIYVGAPVIIEVCYHNDGPKVHEALLRVHIPTDAIFVIAGDIDGYPGIYNTMFHDVNWYLHDINHNHSACGMITIYFMTTGTKSIYNNMWYEIGECRHMSVATYCDISIINSNTTNLLRYNGVTSLTPLTPPANMIFPLTTVRDLEQSNFTSGSYFPSELLDYSSNTPALVFYQIPIDTDTLRVMRDTINNKILITF
jgi:hypothetical protein